MVSSLRIGSVVAFAVLVAGLAISATPASAATRPAVPAGTRPAVPAGTRPVGSAAPVSKASAPTTTPKIAKIKAAPGFGRTSRPPMPKMPHTSGGQRAAAARAALTGTKQADTCSGQIQPDTVYPCTTPSAGGTDTFTFSLTSTTDLLFFRIINAQGDELSFSVTAPGGGTLACQQPAFNQLPQCPTDLSGTYTLAVQNGGGSYTLAFRALLSDSACTVANPSFATPTLTASLAAGGVGACYTLAMSTGQILHVNSVWQNVDVLTTVYDSTGAEVCADNQGDCTLTGTAPYFVEVDAVSGDAITYYLDLNDISDPQGCLAGPQLTYGTAPDTSSADRCRTLAVGTAGSYQIYAVSPQDGVPTSTVYTQDGTVACTSTYSSTAPYCQLAKGTYELIADPYPEYLADIGTVFIAADESRGCETTGDTGFYGGPATGTFAGTGEELCLTLPKSAGPAVYLLNQPTADGSSPQLNVVDATGAQVCQSNGYVFADCALTGTAPFRIILSGQSSGGGYRVLAQSSGSDKGCGVWPQSGFGGSWGATVKLTHVADAACLSVPAKQHSTGEMIDYSNNTNTTDGAIYVYDPTGKNVCIGASTAICSYTAGVTYTALVILADGPSDTYHLVRRDVSSTAHCSVPASTKVGGPSTTLELTSDLDTECFRVTGTAADKYSFDIRSEAPDQAGAILQVTNASGVLVCGQYAGICYATGSTTYQLLVTSLGYQGIAITAHVDSWLVSAGSGWVAGCKSHELSGATGWAPIAVHLSEATTGYCAILTVDANEDTEIISPSFTGSGVDQPYLELRSAADWTSEIDACASGQPYVGCDLDSLTAPGQYALLVYPFELPVPATLSFQGFCDYGCTAPTKYPVITSVKPASGPAGSLSKLVVGGTNLNLGVQVELARNGSDVAGATPLSLSANGKELTVLMDTEGVTPGKYDVAQFGVGYTTGVPSPGYLPGAYKVTAAPPGPATGSFVPDGPARLLQKQVSPHVAVTVAVPAKGADAAVLSLTATRPARSGTVIAYPYGTTRPQVTDLSFSKGQASSAQVVVPVKDGKVDLYNDSAGKTGLTAVLSGYITSTGTHDRLKLTGPVRILNKVKVGAGRTLHLTLAGRDGVPKTGVGAVELSVTVPDPSRTGTLTGFAGGKRPEAGQLGFSAGQTTSDLITIPVANGKISLYNGSSGPVNLTADVTGYFAGKGADLEMPAPVRVLDTRTGLGGAGVSVLAHSAADLSVNDLPGYTGLQPDVVLGVTVLDSSASGSLSVFPDGSALPSDPNLHFGKGKQVTVQVIVPITGPSIDFYNNSGGKVQILADVEGYGVTTK